MASPSHQSLGLTEGFRTSGLTISDLWVRYAEVGGNGTAVELGDHVENDHCPNAYEHDLIAQALNDTFVERGEDHPVVYEHLAPNDDAHS